MEEFISNDTVKEKLIIAGLTELELHGFADFSLRRVAAACNVSCAAPYKHFKDKEDFIGEIISYADTHWLKLSEQVMAVLGNNKQKQLIEMCIAFVNFCTGNSQFRSIFMMNLGKDTQTNMSRSIIDLAESYFEKLPVEEKNTKVFKINSLVLGAVAMTGNNKQKNNEIIAMLRISLEKEIQN